MSERDDGLRGDERAVSEVLGAVLVFGLLVSLVVLAQVTLIPDQNARIEFQHSEQVQRDVIDLRNQMIQATASGNPNSVTLATGTRYPSRLLFLNPPTPTGTFGTIDGGTISSDDGELNVQSVCGTSGPATTNFMRYSPSYNEYAGARPITLENSVVHRSETGLEPLFDTEQILVRGNQITVIRTAGNVTPTSRQTTSIDLVPSGTGITSVGSDADNSGELSISIPSELTVSDWEQLTANEPFVTDVTANGPDVRIELAPPDGSGSNPDEYIVRCSTIGINQQPQVTPPTAPPGGGGGQNGSQINPTSTNDIVFENALIFDDPDCPSGEGGATCKVNVSFHNPRNADVQIVEARFVFYSMDSQGESGPARPQNPPDIANYSSTTFEVRGPAEPVNGDVIPAKNNRTIEIFFMEDLSTGTDVEEGDWFVLRLQFEDQSSGDIFLGRYFIPPEDPNS